MSTSTVHASSRRGDAMPRGWVNVPLDTKLSENTDESALGVGLAEVENGYQTEQGTHARWLPLKSFAALGDPGRVYLHEWRGDLIAATSGGRFYRISKDGTVDDRTGEVIAGGRRVVFARSEDEIIMAAGAELIRFAGDRTEILSEDAPLSTHVGILDSYVIAIEKDTGRFRHAEVGTARVWNSLDLFAANGSPDKITSLLVTPFRELLVAGPDSIEQFERNTGGTLPFFRRWTIGIGVKAPYIMTFADNAVFTINNLSELVRFSGQQAISVGDAIGLSLEAIDDWTDAWMGGHPDRPLHLKGQKFLILQFPNATNRYGTKGVTYAYDYRLKRPYRLYGWDEDLGVPRRYPIWSHWTIWNRHFVGAEGAIYEYTNF